MTQEPDETYTRKEIQKRFEKLFNRKMTPAERAVFFLPPETENEKARQQDDDPTLPLPSVLVGHAAAATALPQNLPSVSGNRLRLCSSAAGTLARPCPAMPSAESAVANLPEWTYEYLFGVL